MDPQRLPILLSHPACVDVYANPNDDWVRYIQSNASARIKNIMWMLNPHPVAVEMAVGWLGEHRFSGRKFVDIVEHNPNARLVVAARETYPKEYGAHLPTLTRVLLENLSLSTEWDVIF